MKRGGLLDDADDAFHLLSSGREVAFWRMHMGGFTSCHLGKRWYLDDADDAFHF